VQLFPALRFWYWNFGLAMTAAGFIAFCSWHLIEKPILSRKNMLQVMDDAIGNLWRQMRRAPPSPTLGDL
jgi:peptidoglycan/LPS O-acetylase OafA/YrhL